MRSQKSTLMGLPAVAALALASAQPPAHLVKTTGPTRPRPTPSKYPADHQAWDAAVDAKRAAKKARKI